MDAGLVHSVMVAGAIVVAGSLAVVHVVVWNLGWAGARTCNWSLRLCGNSTMDALLAVGCWVVT